PSAANRAMGAFTGTFSVPAGTKILATTPSSTASTSMVALSVSISAMTSPALTTSPSLIRQEAKVPSVMVGDKAGINILIDIYSSPLSVYAYTSVHTSDGSGSGLSV